ncbi:hypothetical protein Acr_07g0000500 [Actinidia rufa]|uniref:Uncharacterized protein n=1 Tax=Actinidia rufa TaxID=165716 RepID=A0A7J0ETW0_9ERIC|nr:hypothetical protein Acr_07g0000500 [Actinidia rufa]
MHLGKLLAVHITLQEHLCISLLVLLAHGLDFVKSQLRQIAAGSDLSNNSERGRDADDSSPDAGSFSMGSQSAHELSVVLSQVDIWLGCAELLQSLLGSGVVDPPKNRESALLPQKRDGNAPQSREKRVPKRFSVCVSERERELERGGSNPSLCSADNIRPVNRLRRDRTAPRLTPTNLLSLVATSATSATSLEFRFDTDEARFASI